MSDLDGAPLATVRLHYGPSDWLANVTGTGGALPALGPCTLTVGDLVLKGFVVRSDYDVPDRPHSVVQGAPGWELPLTEPLSLQADVGVRLSSVLAELSRRAGQPIEQPPDMVIGTAFAVDQVTHGGQLVRLKDVLATLVSAGYCGAHRVDPDGVTRFGARVGVPVTARATPLPANVGAGLRVIGLDSVAPMLPGNVVNGVVVSTLVVREEAAELQADLYAATPTLFDPILRAVAERYPAVLWGFKRRYIVKAVHDNGDLDVRCDLVPPPDAPYLAPLPLVEQWIVGGIVVIPKVGADVAVEFHDAQPSRPVLAGIRQSDVVEVRLGGSPGAAVARAGDSVTVPFPPVCVAQGTINGTIPFVGTIQFPMSAIGTINDGSTIVTAKT